MMILIWIIKVGLCFWHASFAVSTQKIRNFSASIMIYRDIKGGFKWGAV